MDELTQRFATRYAKYHAALSVKEDRITEEQMQQRILMFEQHAYSDKFRAQLTNGTYSTADGIVKIKDGKVTVEEPHFQEKKMYQQFADLSRRMNGVIVDKETATKEYAALQTEERAWLVKHVDDIEIGVHSVLGGVVTVKEAFFGKHITFAARDEAQEFAEKYAAYSIDIYDTKAEIATLKDKYGVLRTDRDEYYRDSRDQLVDGTYTVDGGTVTINELGVTFHV